MNETKPTPEWRTLKGVQTPFLVYGHDRGNYIALARNSKAVEGDPIKITRMHTTGGVNYGYDADSRLIIANGTATKFWILCETG